MSETRNRPPTTKRLFLMTNDTDKTAILTNLKHESDTTKVPRITMTHTGGADGDYCVIPNCANASDFSSDHMVVEGEGFKIAFWCDEKTHELCYSLDATYDGKKLVRDSKQWDEVSLLLMKPARDVEVTFFPF
jgi:hypothetical protein